MWGTDNTVSNGACSDPVPSPVNGTAQCDHNDISPDAASTAVSYCSSSSSENHAVHHVPSKYASEKTSLSKCAVSDASDVSVSHGATSASADSEARPLAASSVNCHSSTRTSRYLYSNRETDDDGYFACSVDCSTWSTPNGATGHVCQSVCGDRFPSGDVYRQSCFPTLVTETVQSDSNLSHAYACAVNDGRCTESEPVSVGANVASSRTITDLAVTSDSMPANTDLDDDGYMDEMDGAALSAMDVRRHGDSAVWFVETDACLDDFIDADMPHNAAVTGSTSTSSLSSTHDEMNSMPENGSSNIADGLADDAVNLSDSDVSVNSQRQLHDSPWQSSHLEEHETAFSSCLRFGHDNLNDSYDQFAACTSASPTQMSDNVITHAWRGINTQIDSSNLASESAQSTPLMSLLHSFSDNCYSTATDAEPATSVFCTTVASKQVLEDCVPAGADTAVRKPSDTSETYDRPTGPKQNHCYWLPTGTESDTPKFVCWSCFEVMNSAELSLPAGHVVPGGRPRPADGRNTGVMSRSATADYSSCDPSDLLTDDGENSFASVLSTRIFSSITL